MFQQYDHQSIHPFYNVPRTKKKRKEKKRKERVKMNKIILN